jgi:cation-transporting ATPase 13A1
MELFKEHLVAPFFVFQLFCVALWFLDEMWYYSLFTLFMLMVFEATVVIQRLKNLQEFRSMSIKPYMVNVYRFGKWEEISTDKLLPFDILSLVRCKDDVPVPSDLLILDGSCIANEAMLSGESTPQLKESVDIREPGEIFNMEQDKGHVVFGGTKVLQVTSGSGDIKTPDGGALTLVLRTGFSTEQGKLVRTIIYSTERVTANNMEALLFILFLLVFAVIASWYVWTEGSKDDERSQSKLLLHCILIITSVVPPELPMELSLAVNNSLVALSRMYIFCTEPFRIPFAGRIDIACFDKTGTLTAENLIVEGVAGLDGVHPSEKLHDKTTIPKDTCRVLATAHALARLDDGIIGDPMEKNTLEWINWTLSSSDTVLSKRSGSLDKVKIIKRFHFNSQLKRMSTVSSIIDGNKLFVAVKGAPETIQGMLAKVPEGYEEDYKNWARKGKRVLALAFKYLSIPSSKVLSNVFKLLGQRLASK